MTERQFWWASVSGNEPQVIEISKRLGLTWIFVTGTDECLEEDGVRLIERVLPAGRAAAAASALGDLPEEDRLDVMRLFCRDCGTEQGETRCQCENDE